MTTTRQAVVAEQRRSYEPFLSTARVVVNATQEQFTLAHEAVARDPSPIAMARLDCSVMEVQLAELRLMKLLERHLALIKQESQTNT